MSSVAPTSNFLGLAADIVAAHVSHNAVPTSELPTLIRSIYAALATAGSPAPATTRPEPAVAVRKSVFPDYLVCLEDGRKLQALTRHLRTLYHMTPEDYRLRWGLPDTYPMVAANYAARRSTLAKQSGLGHWKRATPTVEKPVQRIPTPAKGSDPKSRRDDPRGSV